jgi:hypothetical protein
MVGRGEGELERGGCREWKQEGEEEEGAHGERGRLGEGESEREQKQNGCSEIDVGT